MARVLIVGCGCRGQVLARALLEAGHAVRGTTRDPRRAEAIAAAGAEPWVVDPDRVATLMPALAGVTVVCWLLGGASGPSAAGVHGPRLRMALEKMVDTPVRGVLYEPASAPDELREAGLEIARTAAGTWRIPLGVLDAGAAWPEAGCRAVEELLTPEVRAG
jgi:uncharacterized protein YbjT (DUF2867 family)